MASQRTQIVNLPGTVRLAPIRNVTACAAALDRAVQRPRHLPGIVAFYGESGTGKTVAARNAAERYGAAYVSARSSWTRRALLRALARELDLEPARTISELTEQVIEAVDETQRPVVIDEFDHIVSRSLVEVIRDIYDATGCPILLVGEEGLPHQLRRWERFHGRVLEWTPAEFASLEDAQVIRDLYCREVKVSDDLLEQIERVAKGSVRRIVVNLELAHEEGLRRGVEEMDKRAWGRRRFYTGEPPRNRSRRS